MIQLQLATKVAVDAIGYVKDVLYVRMEREERLAFCKRLYPDGIATESSTYLSPSAA